MSLAYVQLRRHWLYQAIQFLMCLWVQHFFNIVQGFLHAKERENIALNKRGLQPFSFARCLDIEDNLKLRFCQDKIPFRFVSSDQQPPKTTSQLDQS